MCDSHHWLWDDSAPATAVDSDTGYIWIYDPTRGCNRTTIKYYDPDRDEVIIDEEGTENLNEEELYVANDNGNNAVIINSVMFHTSIAYGNRIVSVDLDNDFSYDSESINADHTYWYGCTVVDTKRNFIYWISEDSFVVYDIVNNDAVEHEDVLGFDYDEPSCAIANEDQYLYVIGGRTQAIERLDLTVYHGESTDNDNDDSSSSGDWEYIEFDWNQVYNINTTGFCFLDGPETSQDGDTEAAYGVSGATAVTVNEDYIMIFGGTCYAFDYYFGDSYIIYDRDIIQTVVIYDTKKEKLYTSVDWEIPYPRTRGKAIVGEKTEYVYYIAGMSGTFGPQHDTIFKGDIQELTKTIMKARGSSSGTVTVWVLHCQILSLIHIVSCVKWIEYEKSVCCSLSRFNFGLLCLFFFVNEIMKFWIDEEWYSHTLTLVIIIIFGLVFGIVILFLIYDKIRSWCCGSKQERQAAQKRKASQQTRVDTGPLGKGYSGGAKPRTTSGITTMEITDKTKSTSAATSAGPTATTSSISAGATTSGATTATNDNERQPTFEENPFEAAMRDDGNNNNNNDDSISEDDPFAEPD